MNKLMKYFVIGLMNLVGLVAFSQDQDESMRDLGELSLEELMNVPINSASKKDETLFDAPLSSYTITRFDIEKAGSTSIMEALRLAPGLVVRELANGMYDIHIRGMENLTRTNGTFLKTNAYTLVMVDNRPVFNHGLGGTYWESLSIDINDVERVEIVRGPSSPLFGPNAVTGVINIITRRMNDTKTMVSASMQTGNLGTTIANASLGKKFGDKFSIILSGNLQDRNRVDSKYYDQGSGNYEDLDDLIADPATRLDRYPDPFRSVNKWGVNGYFQYQASDDVSVDLTLASQAADFQKIFIDNPLTDGTTDNTSANLSAEIRGLNIRTSYLMGHNIDLRTNAPYAEYNFDVWDAVAEYEIKLGERYSVTPGVSYQSVTFDDRNYVSDGVIGLFNASNTITTAAGYLRTDLNLTEKLRVLGGLRLDKFSDPDDAYLAYELAATYKITPGNLIRAALTRSNSGSFLGYNFVDIGGGVIGSTDLKLFTLDMVEVGFRSQLSNKLQLDLDIFEQEGRNLTAIIQTSGPQQFLNTPTTATQIGATLAVNFVPNEKIQFKPFVTIQRTTTKDLPSLYLDPSLPSPPYPAVAYSNSTHKYTPGSFGGFYLNYKASAKFNINLNGYYFSKQTQYDQSYDADEPGTPQYAQGQIDGKFMINANLSYEAAKNLNVFVNARNLFGSDSREFYAADRTGGLFLAGLSYKLTK